MDIKESSLNQEVKESTPESRLFGLPRPLAGILLGILLFLLIEFLLWRIDLGILAMGLNYLGLFIVPLIHIHLLQVEVLIIYGISSIPFAIAGSLLSSKNVTQKISGTILLAVHISLCIVFSIFFSIMAD
jgi:hypothetical protein